MDIFAIVKGQIEFKKIYIYSLKKLVNVNFIFFAKKDQINVLDSLASNVSQINHRLINF